MRRRSLFGFIAMLALLTSACAQGQQKSTLSVDDKQKLAALLDAYTSGVITKPDYDARVAAVKANASKAKSSTAAPASAVSADETSGERQVKYITDPSFNGMNAVAVSIPAKWHFQGVLFQAGNCASIPYFVFRTSSPDGLSFVERLPALSWGWGSGPMAPKANKDCLPLQGPLGAQDFLKYLASAMKVEYVADEPVPEELQEKVHKQAADLTAALAGGYLKTTDTSEIARAIVRYKNGTFEMKGLFVVRIDCAENILPGMKSQLRGVADRPSTTTHHCTAGVRYTVAPENRFAAIRKMWDAPDLGGRMLDDWQQAWVERNREQAQQIMNASIVRTNAAMQAQQQQFNHDQAVRQQMHEQFLATMQRGTDMSMARTQASMNARSTSTSDWVDYALDQKTVVDPNTGQLKKVSNSFTHTWVDSTGKVSYQTNDPNANPNGVLQGTWTQQQQVHVDGSPY
ncbi:MAG: hypothetical protein WB985_06300 [Candidatus Acidiferrales bacterium]